MGKRLMAIQIWISFNDKELKDWKNLSFEFSDWFDTMHLKIDREEFSASFPTYW